MLFEFLKPATWQLRMTRCRTANSSSSSIRIAPERRDGIKVWLFLAELTALYLAHRWHWLSLYTLFKTMLFCRTYETLS